MLTIHAVVHYNIGSPKYQPHLLLLPHLKHAILLLIPLLAVRLLGNGKR